MADDFAESFEAFQQAPDQPKPAGPQEEGFGASFGSFMGDMDEIGQRNAKLNVFGAKDVKPDVAARAQDLAKETGLPPETVERNMPDVEQQVRAARQDKILRDSPALVGWLQNANNARVAHDDFDKLSFFEKTWKTASDAWSDASLGNERSRLGYSDMMGAGSAKNDQRITDIDKTLSQPRGGDDDIFQRVVKSVSGLVGGFADQLTSAPVVASTALGAGIGAAGGLGVGDAVTVPVGAGAGFIAGLVADGFQTGAGQTWLTLKGLRDRDGQPIDQNLAMGASIVGGLMMGALNAAGAKGGSRPIVEAGTNLLNSALQDALKVPTARAALTTLGTNLAKSAATGAGFGALNEGTMLAVEQSAKLLSGQDFATVFDDPAERQAAADRLVHSMVDMALGFGALGVVGHGTSFATDLSRARQATRDASFLEQINGAATDSATRKRAPDAFASFVEQQANGTPVDTLYIPATKVKELYQRFGVDPFEITDEQDPILGFVPDRKKQLEQGLATNGDIAVPLSQYISRLAGSNIHTALKDDIRIRPDGMTAREAREFEEHYSSLLATRGEEVRAEAAGHAERAVPGMAVMDDAHSQLRAAGFTVDAARQYSALIGARYTTRAAWLGTDAMTEYQRAGLKFDQVLPESLRKYTPDDLDVMLTELKAAKKGPTERELLGPTLLEHLAAKGGLKDVGGDLAAMDADKWHKDKPFRPKLIKETGRGLDDAALTAHESGYFPEHVGKDRPTPDHLLAAIRDELAGKERRPDVGDNRDAAVLERQKALADLDRVLNEAGVDLRQSSVKDAKKAIDRYQRDGGGGYEQAFRPRSAIEFTRLLDALKAGTLGRGEQLPLGETPQALRLAGLPEHPLLLQQTEARKILMEKHAGKMDEEMLRRLPDLLADPIMVFRQDDGKFGALLDNDILVGIRPAAIAGTRKVNLILTVHPRSSPSVFLKAIEEGRVTYRHEVRSQSWFDQARERSPGREPKKGFADENIATDSDLRKAAKAYEQPGEGRARGSVRFQDGQSLISLFEDRDLSTVIHEMGHVFLEELAADAQLAHAPQQIRDDFAAIMKWMKVDDMSKVEVWHHEEFARAFEAYAMEGKAPSVELGGVFQRFKSWLVSIYKSLTALKVPINDDVRAVFDRLIATDDEIAAAREQLGEKQLFGSADQAGMTDKEFAAYTGAVEKARDSAETALLKRVMGDVRRRRQAQWQAEEDTVRETVRKEVDRRADIAALHYLRSGRLPDQVEGVDLPAMKLSRGALIDMYGGDGVLKLMPRGVPPFVVERGGVHPDVVAETIGGFRTGRDLVDALLSLEDQQRQLKERGEKKSLRNWMIDDETSRRMNERHGDMMHDGSIQEEALAVLHNDDALAVHAVELRALGRRSGKSGEAMPLDIARKWAADAIADKTVKDATVLGNYQRTERTAARHVESALLQGDYAEAFRQKQSQMLAAALYSEAKKAADDVESGQRLLNRYAGVDTLKAMDQDYLEQIHGLLERFDFRPASRKDVRRRRAFAEWAMEQEANGVDVVAPQSLMSDAFHSHYTEMTMAEFRGLVDSVKQIAHLGRLKKELIVKGEKAAFDTVVEETVDRLSQLKQRKVADDINPGRAGGLQAAITGAGKFGRRINASLLKMETAFEWLDSKEIAGPFNRVVWEPLAAAQHERNDMLKEYTGKLMDLRKALDKKTQARMLDKVETPELLNKETGRPFKMRLEEVASIALNWGNEGNREKLLKGYGWNEQAVKAVLDRHMTPDLWHFVQGTWDLIETLWPKIEALERRVNGVAPDKVERAEVDTKHGKFAGGYYPVVYDPTKSFDAAERAARNSDSLFENIYTRATTPKGFTKERQDTYARPIFLSLDVIPRHVAEVIHDMTHREALMQADKFLGNREVMKAVEDTLGREYVEQFRPWLQSIASDYAQDRRELAAWDQVAKWSRGRATMVGLGFRITTMLAQPIGLFDSAEAIGTRWVAAGLAEAYGNPFKWRAARDFAFERSGEMRNRMNETERDVRDAMRGLLGKNGWKADAQRFAYYGIAMFDMSVSLPTWLGAYKKALHEGTSESDAISLADRAVRDSQGSGGAKDLAAAQRGSEFMKLTTMFYSYFSHVYQRQATLVRDIKNIESVKDVPHLMARSFFLLVAPALLSAIATGNGPKEEEDWGPWAARTLGVNLFSSVPLVRDVANWAGQKLGGGYARNYQFTPIGGMVETVGKLAADAAGEVTGDGPSDRWVQHALQTSGYVFGLPLGQGGQTAQFLYNVHTGDEQPDGMVEWLKGLTFGKTHDK